ncbi:MAG: PIG-L deacetylase family protein [Hydrogenobacter sp.]
MERKDERSTVVVIAPHPDDEVLGCGGTLYKHAQAGNEVLLYVLTDGSKFLDGNKRKEECVRVSKILGISSVEFLDFPDGELKNHMPSLKSALEERIKDFQKVYAPHPLDHHPDHIATSLTVISIFEEKPSFELHLYGVYNTFRYNQLVDVTDVHEIKKKALLEYSYSLRDVMLMLKRVEGFMRHPILNTCEDKLYEFFFMPEKPMTLSEILGYLTYDCVPGPPHTASKEDKVYGVFDAPAYSGKKREALC